MNRRQKVDRIRGQSGLVNRVYNPALVERQLHPDYEVELCSGLLGETGRLEVLKVVPKSGSGAYFAARWDQRAEDLDFDLCGASKAKMRDFKNGRRGYFGHHTTRAADPNKHIFDVRIGAPQGLMFDGEVSFSNMYQIVVDMQIAGELRADAQVIRAKAE